MRCAREMFPLLRRGVFTAACSGLRRYSICAERKSGRRHSISGAPRSRTSCLTAIIAWCCGGNPAPAWRVAGCVDGDSAGLRKAGAPAAETRAGGAFHSLGEIHRCGGNLRSRRGVPQSQPVATDSPAGACPTAITAGRIEAAYEAIRQVADEVKEYGPRAKFWMRMWKSRWPRRMLAQLGRPPMNWRRFVKTERAVAAGGVRARERRGNVGGKGCAGRSG